MQIHYHRHEPRLLEHVSNTYRPKTLGRKFAEDDRAVGLIDLSGIDNNNIEHITVKQRI